jgi:hypothetical protein
MSVVGLGRTRVDDGRSSIGSQPRLVEEAAPVGVGKKMVEVEVGDSYVAWKPIRPNYISPTTFNIS